MIAADCETVDAAWKNVITDPTLPVEHETEVTLSCPTDHTNQGGDRAVCRDGTLSPTGTPPLCKGTGLGQHLGLVYQLLSVRRH